MFNKIVYMTALLTVVSLPFASTAMAQSLVEDPEPDTYYIAGEVLASGIVDVEVVEGIAPCLRPVETKAEAILSGDIINLEFSAELETTEEIAGADVNGLTSLEKFELKSDQLEEDLYEVKVETEGRIDSMEVGDNFVVEVEMQLPVASQPLP